MYSNYYDTNKIRNWGTVKKVKGKAAKSILQPCCEAELIPSHRGGYVTAFVKRKNGETKLLADLVPNVLCNSGRDKMHTNVYIGTSLSGSAFNYIAHTEDTTQTIQASETALTSEITTNGLARTQATTRNHTNGTNSSLIEHTFTISGAGFTNVVRSAIFDAASTGNMSHFAAYGTGSGTLAAGDTLKSSWTNNLG